MSAAFIDEDWTPIPDLVSLQPPLHGIARDAEIRQAALQEQTQRMFAEQDERLKRMARVNTARQQGLALLAELKAGR